jgi:hypothetical protein
LAEVDPTLPRVGTDLVAIRLGGMSKNFFDDLSNSGGPFDYIVKAGQSARPKTKKIKTVTGEKKSHATVSGF